MRTEILTSENTDRYNASFPTLVRAVRDGALVIFPTETVYGLGASALHADAIRRLRAVKGRGFEQPFTVHLPDRRAAAAFAASPPPLATRFARRAWPGPLTLICPVASPEAEPIAADCPAECLASIYRDNKVGLRCPDQAMATRLLAEVGVPIIASSANRAGQAPPGSCDAAIAALDDEIDWALDAGQTRHTQASTIVEIDGDDWRIVRAGVLDQRMLERMATTEVLMVCTGNTCRSPLAEHLFRTKLAAKLNVAESELSQKGYRVSSAGTFGTGGQPISSGSFDELARRGIDASAHRSQGLSAELLQRCERIYTMSPEHRAIVLELAPNASERVVPLDPDGQVPDPVGGSADDYRRCADQIERAVDARLEEFLNEDRNW